MIGELKQKTLTPEAIQSDILLTHNNYAFKKLIPENFKEVGALLTNAFFYEEPLTKLFVENFPREETFREVQKLWEANAQQTCKDQIGIGCFDTSNNNELAGVTIGRDVAFNPHEGKAHAHHGNSITDYIGLIYDETVRRTDPKYQSLLAERNTVIRLGIAIKTTHTGKDLAKRMFHANEYLGWIKGFKYVLVFTTNVKSAAVAKKRDFEKISEVNVKEFQIDGVRYFQKIDEANEMAAMWIKPLNFDSPLSQTYEI